MARTLKEHPADEDGLRRNLRKLDEEADKMIAAVKGACKSHDPIMNAATEAARASPYGFAHLAVVVIAILAIALGVAILV